MQPDHEGPATRPTRRAVPRSWVIASALVSVGALLGQAAFAARVTYQSEVVDPSYGWSSLLLIYSIPFVALLLTIWAALEWHRRRGSTWVGIAIIPTAIAVSIGSAVLGIVAGTLAADHLA